MSAAAPNTKKRLAVGLKVCFLMMTTTRHKTLMMMILMTANEERKVGDSEKKLLATMFIMVESECIPF